MSEFQKVPVGVRIIGCVSIAFEGKDIITLKEWDDLIWLMGGSSSLFKLKNNIYFITGEVAYVYQLSDKENG